MKQALYIILFLSLFAFLNAEVRTCPFTQKIVCKQYKVITCTCVSQYTSGYYAVELKCQSPRRPRCTGNDYSVNCTCN
jgi:hypothetical protein